MDREATAYLIIGVVAIGCALWLAVALHRSKRTKLRRRGIKRFTL